MNERSDISRVLQHWFDDGPSTMPDRVVDVVADRIARQSRAMEARLGLVGRGHLGLAFAAVVVGC